MANLWLLAVCFVLGAVAQKSGRFWPQTPQVLTGWVMFLALPALVLKGVHHVPLTPRLLLCSAVLWMLFALAAAAALWVFRRGRTSAKTAGAWALTAGIGNTAFLGLPLLSSLGGSQAVEIGLVVDQLGSFVAVTALAVPFAAHLSGRHTGLPAIGRRIFAFPPFWAMVAALVLRPYHYPAAVETVLTRFADTLSPLALFCVGWRLEFFALKRKAYPLSLGLLFKMAVAPALALLVLKGLSPSFQLFERVTVAQAAMAPMVSGHLLAIEYGLDDELGALMVGVGVPLSLLTVPLWWALLA